MEEVRDLGSYEKVRFIYSSLQAGIPIIGFPGYQTRGETLRRVADECEKAGIFFNSVIPVSKDPELRNTDNVGIEELCEQGAELLLQTLKQIKGTDVIVYASSTGAVPAISLLQNHAHNIKGMFLVNPLVHGEQLRWENLVGCTPKQLKEKLQRTQNDYVKLKHPEKDGSMTERLLPKRFVREILEYKARDSVYPHGYPESCKLQCPLTIAIGNRDERLHPEYTHYFWMDVPKTAVGEKRRLQYNGRHYMLNHLDEIINELISFTTRINEAQSRQQKTSHSAPSPEKSQTSR